MSPTIGTPVISIAIAATTEADRERLGRGLQQLVTEDPNLRVRIDQDAATVAGMGELHLEIVMNRLRREFNVDGTFGPARIIYKEALTRQATGEMKYAKPSGAMALQSATKKAEPVLLEPVMRVRVVGPTENMAGVAENLAGRRGEIESQENDGPTTIVGARVPMAEMIGYAVYLRSRTEGRGTYSLTFDRYEPFRGDIGGDDRSSFVGAPVRPAPNANNSALAVPEPDDDRFEGR